MSIYRDWIQSLLARHNIPRPDGRPLYAYRLTNSDFSELSALLRPQVTKDIEFMGSKDHFLTCWFMYATEWWKRNYPGGAWSWGPIFTELGYVELDPNVRRQWVEKASQFWKLRDENIGGKKYLGKVVVNGGLPLQLIKEAEGSIYRLLNAALNEALRSSTPLSHAQLLNQIELQSAYLPKSYRQQTVYLLLAQVVSTILKLKNSLPGMTESDPLEALDRTNPEWLNEFPLQIDSESARRLFGKLIREAVTSARQVKQAFAIVRQLRFNEGHSEWRFECLLEAASRYPVSLLSEMLGIDDEAIPGVLDLVVSAEDRDMTVGQMFRRDADFLVKIGHPNLPTSFFHKDLRLNVSRFGQKIGDIELENSEPPDPETPWIFEDREPVAKLVWAGSHKLRVESCLVLVPESAVIPMNETIVTPLSHFNQQSLIRIHTGVAEIQINHDGYEVICGVTNARSQESVVWGNNRVYIDSDPPYIFSGIPRLSVIDGDGNRNPVPANELIWRCNRIDTPVSDIRNCRTFGIGTLLWMRTGKILLRQRAVCLPAVSGAAEGLITSSTRRVEYQFLSAMGPNGIIQFIGWPLSAVNCVTPNIYMDARRNHANWELTFTSQSAPAPMMVELVLFWPDGKTQKVKLPFPVEGAYLVDDQQRTVNSKGLLSLDQIHFLQVHLRGKANRAWQISLELQHRNDTTRIPAQIIRFRPINSDHAQVVRLYDLRDAVRRLLSLSDNLDVRVRMHFQCGENSKLALTIARYSESLVIDQHKGWVSLESLEGATYGVDVLEKSDLKMVPLLAAEQSEITLPSIKSAGVPVGSWDYRSVVNASGLWVVYSSERSELKVRPVLLALGEDAHEYEGLKAAMSVRNRSDRIAAITNVLREMAEDPQHGDWPYIQILLDRFGHLPLASVDLWIAMVRVPKAIVLSFLMLESFNEKVARRLCDELPFEWVMTSPQDWLSSIKALRIQAKATGNEREERFLKSDLEYRLEWINEHQPALFLSVRLALSEGLGLAKSDKETQFLLESPHFLARHFRTQLLVGELSDAASFLRRASQLDLDENSIPKQLKVESIQFASTAYGKFMLADYRSLDITDQRFSLLVAPMLIAYAVAKGEATGWLQNLELLHALRQYREFDRMWFDECYKVSMACAFKDGLILI